MEVAVLAVVLTAIPFIYREIRNEPIFSKVIASGKKASDEESNRGS